jgi:hypothetical protein
LNPWKGTSFSASQFSPPRKPVRSSPPSGVGCLRRDPWAVLGAHLPTSEPPESSTAGRLRRIWGRTREGCLRHRRFECPCSSASHSRRPVRSPAEAGPTPAAVVCHRSQPVRHGSWPDPTAVVRHRSRPARCHAQWQSVRTPRAAMVARLAAAAPSLVFAAAIPPASDPYAHAGAILGRVRGPTPPLREVAASVSDAWWGGGA